MKKAQAEREDYLAFLRRGGVRFAEENLSKPYLGALSPGCRACIRGTWSCLYLNGLCTRSCFYCPQDRENREEKAPKTDDDFIFRRPEDYVAYLKRYPFEGISFSGGEPFLVFETLLAYVRAIRTTLGTKPYLWAYTNGDLVTEAKARQLREAGLNELRFNLSANRYDSKGIQAAVHNIDTVTIEMPAIPEDLEIVKSKLGEWEAVGVKHLNLHQLMINDFNREAFVERNYTLTNTRLYENGQPVLESELTALALLTQAVRINSRLGVNYCSRCYKARFQERGYRKRHVSLFKPDGDSVTETGFFRRCLLQGSGKEVTRLENVLRQVKITDYRKKQGPEKTEITFPVRFLARLLSASSVPRVILRYFNPGVIPSGEGEGDRENTTIISGNAVYLNRESVLEYELSNATSIVFFQKLFLEKKGGQEVRRELMNLYELEGAADREVLEDIRSFYKHFEGIEYLGRDLPDYG